MLVLGGLLVFFCICALVVAGAEFMNSNPDGNDGRKGNGKRGADMRPDFHWDKQAAIGAPMLVFRPR